MEGVKILSQEIIYNTILPEWCAVLGFFCMIICVIAGVYAAAEGYDALAWICVVVTIASIIVSCLGFAESKTDISHIEYKVTIDDSVSMNEFLEKYEIIDQEGKIYTVKERG